MANSITLSKETIKAINSYAENYTPYKMQDYYDLDYVEFKQGDNDIIVSFHIYGHWNCWTEKHGELPPPNEEYFAEWAYVGHDITEITAYNEEGEEIEITNADKLENI